jgi:hypothetical protein
MGARIVFLLVGLSVTALPSNVRAAKLSIQHGAQNAVCKTAAEISSRVSERDFWAGEWRNAFATVNWLDDTYPTVTVEGREQRITYRRIGIDIDNDGKRDVVIRYTGMQGSVDWDWIYVLAPSEFQAARKQDGVGKLLQTAPRLNPDNSVQFTNGSSGVPVEVQIWKHGKTNYVVLKEHFFLKGKPNLPSSLFVGLVQTRSDNSPGDAGSRSLPVELVCRIRGS